MFSINDERSAAVERIEHHAWIDAWRAVDGKAASLLEMAHAERAGVALTAMRTLDFWLFNRAQGIGCDGPTSEADVADAVTWLRAHCAPDWRIQLARASLTGGFDAWAAELGVAHKGRGSAKMYRDASPLPPTGDDVTYEVRPVGLEQTPPCLSVCAAGFGLPLHVVEALVGSLVDRPRWHLYAACREGVAVAFGTMFVRGEWAWLGWGATSASHRGRGAQSAILRRRVADGSALGVQHFVVACTAPSAGDRSTYTSYRNIVRAGFCEAHRCEDYGPPQVTASEAEA